MPKKKNDDCCNDMYPDHAKALPRLNRISGQLEGVKRMIKDRRYCPDIITQLRAIRAAASAIEAEMLNLHLDSCVATVFKNHGSKEMHKKIAELKDLYKRF
jgi:DNA-binding FrmR family transcriptional regulator